MARIAERVTMTGALAAVACLPLAAAQISLTRSVSQSRHSGMSARRALASTDMPAMQAHGSTGAVLGAIFAGLTVLAVVTLIAAFTYRTYRKGKASEKATAEAEAAAAQAQQKADDTGVTSLLCLTFNDVQVATEGFKPEGVLSDKPHGSVHRAEGPNGERWAVKRAKGVSLIGEHLFRNEVDFLAKVTHPNILSFQAFSDDCNEQILVFEYMPQGSLASWLRPPPELADRAPLPFTTRLDIALGVADALCFLHSFSKPTIIHRDVVSDSVLLDGAFQAKLGSLGLLKHLPGEGLWMRMAQKKGYLDPEYFQTFKVTAKCDVYSFGVVLLELLTARPPVIQASRVDQQRPMTLPQWALQSIAAGKILELLDARMPKTEGGYSEPLAEKFAQIACECVAPLRKNRPEMLHVAASLRALRTPAEGSSKPGLFSRFVRTSSKIAPGL